MDTERGQIISYVKQSDFCSISRNTLEGLKKINLTF